MWLNQYRTWSLLVLSLATIVESGYHDNGVKTHRGRQANSNFECREEGYHADPRDCMVYYRCVDWGNGGPLTKFRFECGVGTVFSKDRGDICTHPNESGRSECGGSDESDKTNDVDSNNNPEREEPVKKRPESRPPNGPSYVPSYGPSYGPTNGPSYAPPNMPSYASPSGPSYQPANKPSYGPPSGVTTAPAQQNPSWSSPQGTDATSWTGSWGTSTESSNQIPSDSANGGGFQCQSDGFFADPQDCSKFYRCVEQEGSYQKFTFNCGEGTVWDPQANACNHAWAVNREDCKVSSSSGSSGSPQQNGNNNGGDEPSNPSNHPPAAMVQPPCQTETPPSTGGQDGNPGSSGSGGNPSQELPSNPQEPESYPGQNPPEETPSYPQQPGSYPGQNPSGEQPSYPQQPGSYPEPSEPGQGPSGEQPSQPQQPESQPEENVNPSEGEGHEISNEIPTPIGQGTPGEPPASTDNNPEQPETSQPPTEPLSPGATCKSEGFFGDSANCRKFYRCVGSGSTFTKYEFECGEGTVWDDRISSCNHKYAVPKCSGDTDAQNGSGSENQQPEGENGVESGTGSEGDSNEGKEPEAENEVNPDTSSPGGSTGESQEPEGQNEVSSGTGSPGDSTTENQQPEGQNQVTSSPSSPGDATSEGQQPDGENGVNSSTGPSEESTSAPDQSSAATDSAGVTEASSPGSSSGSTYLPPTMAGLGTSPGQPSLVNRPSGSGDCKEEGFFSDPKDCKKFYRCVDNNGKLTKYEFECGEGTAWDDKLQTCNHAYAVPGCGGDSSSSPSQGQLPEGNPPSGGSNGEQGETQPGESSSETPATEASSLPPMSQTTDESTENPAEGSSTSEGATQESSTTTSQAPETSESSESSEGTTVSSGNETPGESSESGQDGNQSTETSSESTPAEGEKEPETEESNKPGEDGNQPTESSSESSPAPEENKPETGEPSNPEEGGDSGSGVTPPEENKPESGDSNQPEQGGNQPAEGSSESTPTSEENKPESEVPNKPRPISTQRPSGSGADCNGEGFFANKNDCRKFYRCVGGGNGYQKYDFDCAPGTAWDQNLLTCNHINQVASCKAESSNEISDGKEEGGQEGSTSGMNTSAESSTAGNPDEASSTEQSANTVSSTVDGDSSSSARPAEMGMPESTSESSESSSSSSSSESSSGNESTTRPCDTPKPISGNNNGIVCNEAGFNAHPTICTKFYRCVDNGNGFNVYHFDCAPGTIFDPSINVCNWPNNVYPARNCQGDGTGPESSTPKSESTSPSTTTDESSTTAGSGEETTSGESSEAPTSGGSSEETTTGEVTTAEVTTEASGETSTETTESTTSQEEQPSTTETETSSETQEATTTGAQDQSTTEAEQGGSTEVSTETTTTAESEETSDSSSSETTEQTTTSNETEETSDSSSSTETTEATTDPGSEKLPTGATPCPLGNLTGEQIVLVCPTGFKRHPKYCNLFYQCITEANAQVKILSFACPEDTIFDEDKIQCLPESESSKPCMGVKAGSRFYRRVESNSMSLMKVEQSETLCPGVGHYPYRQGCSNVFYKCKRDSRDTLQGYMYKCPQDFVYWSVSRRCERSARLPMCSHLSFRDQYENDKSNSRWQLPVEDYNLSARMMRYQ